MAGEKGNAGGRGTGIKMTSDSTVVQLQLRTNTQWHSFMLIHSSKLWSRGWLLPVKWHQRQTWPCSKANAQLGHTAAELNRPTNPNKGFPSKQKTHISVQKYISKAAYICTIINHHYASFKKTHLMVTRQERREQTNQERNQRCSLTMHI